MATQLEVTCITKSADGKRITHIGGTWGKHSEADAIYNIEHSVYEYYVQKNGHKVKLIVSGRNGVKYVKTENDGDTPDNLLSLPNC